VFALLRGFVSALCLPSHANRRTAELQQQAETIDFDALRAQAQAALASLQQSREARVASVASTAF